MRSSVSFRTEREHRQDRQLPIVRYSERSGRYYLTPFLEKPWSWDTRLRCGGRFKKRIESFNPDMVVSLHPMTQAR